MSRSHSFFLKLPQNLTHYNLVEHPGFTQALQDGMSQGDISLFLPLEMVAKVWSELTMADLIVYGGTSKANYAIVQASIRSSLEHLLLPFVRSGGVNQFLSVLSTERAVISGSMALFFMLSCSLTGVQSGQGWGPADMDVYEPNDEDRRSNIVGYLIVEEGYKEVGSKVSALGEGYNLHSRIKKVTRLRRGRHIVDVIITVSPDAIAAIMGFHSTPVMNWISGDGVFSAYPQLLSKKRGLVNSMGLTLPNFSPKLPPANVRMCLKKYFNRGFDIRRNPSCWPGDKHVCCSSVNCPHTVRSMLDHGTMYYRFKKSDELAGIHMTGGIDYKGPYCSQYILYWSIGGPSCDQRHRVTRPFIMHRGEADD